MTEKELSRYDIIKNLLDHKINGSDAAKQIGISVRHIKRLKARAVKFGAAGLIHRSRGREGNRKLDEKIIALAKKHLGETYYDFRPTFAAEKLLENHQIKINKETVSGNSLKKRIVLGTNKSYCAYPARPVCAQILAVLKKHYKTAGIAPYINQNNCIILNLP